MHRVQKILFLFLICFGPEVLNAQLFYNADRKFRNLEYSEAIPIYEKRIRKDSTNAKAWANLGDCYRLTNQPEKAEFCYSYAIKDPAIPKINKLYYAQALLTNGKDEEAKTWFAQYYFDNPNDVRSKEIIDVITNKRKLVQDSNRFVISKININTKNAEFGAVKYREGIVFASSMDKKDKKLNKIDPWTGKPYVSIYYSKGSENTFTDTEIFNSTINLGSNNGPVCFNAAGTEMFFTGNDPYPEYKTDENHKTEKLCIFIAKIENGKFGKPVSFPYNNDDYSCAHPCLTPDGSRLYFSSDMEGTIGGMDLWYSDRIGDTWGEPKNLGMTVNTPGNEVYPTMDNDGNIYFSSSGLPGIGGLDIFSTYYTGDGFAIPNNMGAPINSADDDFSLCFDLNTNSGYLSSNRYHQNENDDIFSIKSNMIPLMGIIYDKLTNEPCNGCSVYINKDGENIGMLKTDMNGKFRTSLIPAKMYEFITKNKDYVDDTLQFTADKDKMAGDSLTVNIEIENTFAANNVIVWNKILYDVDMFHIRPDAALELNKLVDVMKRKPELKIELGAHTDCRASAYYNMMLSEKRAQSAIDYLVLNGIDKQRLVAKGYGETKPLNNCECKDHTSTNCSEEEHQLNRRTEITILASDPSFQ